MNTYQFWTDDGDQRDIRARNIMDAAIIAARRITARDWADGAWGIVRGPDGQMDVRP